MQVSTNAGRLAVLLMLLAAGFEAGAQTQTYRCRSGNSSYLSSVPCTTGAGQKIGVIGPLDAPQALQRQTYIAPVGKAPEHLAYLGAECATLNDAVRTAPARGVSHQVISELHAEYRTKCAEEDADARRRVSQERGDQAQARRAELAARQGDRERAQRERDQCHELLRILHGKRQRRADMSPGEQGDLDRSEANYRERCVPH